MAVTNVESINRFIGLSTDTKPVVTTGLSLDVGASFIETDTGTTYIWNGYAWLPDRVTLDGVTVNYKQISLNQAAATYDVMTATTQNLFIDAVVVHIPADLSAVAVFTGISVQTDDAAPIEILSAAAAKANLTGNFFHVYTGPVVNASTKKIQLTIAGATAGAGAVADVTVIWRPVVAGGYYLNA